MIKTGSTISADDFVLPLTAGESLSARDAVYISAADGKVYKCDADDLTKIDFIGFAQEAAALNGAVNVITWGVATGFSSLTVGAVYFLSTTAGGVTATPPTNKRIVGVATSATTIRIERPTKRIVTFTGSGTWTKYAGLKYVEVEVQGAGGNGATDGAGGGGGGYSRKMIHAADLSATETVTVGAAGAGSGDTSFGSHAIGGNGGNASGDTQGAGGTASGGDVNVNGGPGSGGNMGTEFGGAGGGSVLGHGAPPTMNGSATSSKGGANGSGYGGGGAGGATATDGSPSGAAGGSGTQGIVIVHEYY